MTPAVSTSRLPGHTHPAAAGSPDARPRAAGPPRPARSRLWWTVVALVVAAGVVLRFLAAGPLWLDEAQSVAIARLPLAQLFDALRQDGSPPLYYLLLHGWMAAFGESAGAVRALSGVLSVAALPAAYVVARVHGRQVAVAAVVLLAGAPWALRYATETRMYSLELLLVLMALLALRRVTRRPGSRAVVGLGAVLGALLLTHYWALFAVALIAAVALGAWCLRPAARRPAGRVLAGVVLGAAAFAPWAPSFLFQARHTGAPWAGSAGILAVPATVAAWAGMPTPQRWLELAGYVALLAAALFSARWGRPARSLAVGALGVLLLGWAAAQLGKGAYVNRYTMVAFPLFVICLALGASALRHGRVLLVGTAAVGLAAGAVLAGQPRTQAGEIAAALDASARPGDVVVYCPDQLSPSVHRLLRAPVTELPYPDGAAGRIDWVDYVQRIQHTDPGRFAARAVGAAAPSGHVWLVTSSYRLFREPCQRLQAALRQRLGAPTAVVPQKSWIFEHAEVLRWSTR